MKKELNKKRVGECALQCFVEKGIEETTIPEIAEQAGITERTVYRYFGTKENLVIEAALLLWEMVETEVEQKYKESDVNSMSGAKQIELLIKGYADLCFLKKQELIFAYEAESYLNRKGKALLLENKPPLAYEQSVGPLAKAIHKGLEDGTVRKDIDMEILYYNTYDALLGFIQKLIISGRQDEDFAKMAQRRIDAFCEIMVAAYENRELS